MIVYGTRNVEIAKEHIVDKCPHCGTQNSIDMHVFQKYAHLFWVPFFPMGKTGVSQCDHCKQVLKLKEMPDSLNDAYHHLKANSRTPIWTFSGLALLAVLIGSIIIADQKKDEKNAQLIVAPKAGDVFEVKIESGQYTLYKVEEVKADSVFIVVNNYEVNKLAGLYKLRDKDYSEDVYVFTAKQLKEMLDKGEIVDIERK